MIGGLFKTTSLAALVAATGLFVGQASPAKAADLGGDCCADLEERVAELEATTVRKGTRKVSVTLSGFVAHNVMWWDDGSQSDVYYGDGGNYGSRFRFVGTAKINPNVTAGFLYEFGVANNSISSMNQLNGGDDLGGVAVPGILRDSTVWLEHKTLGRVKVGHGSTSTDNLVLIDLSGCGGACTPDVALYNGGFLLRANNASFGTTAPNTTATWNSAIRGHESWDTSRRNHVLYQTPTIAGFQLQAAVAEDNYWDVALRYAGEFGGFRIAGGIGYQQDSEFNTPTQAITANALSPLCSGLCEVKTSEWKGALSIMHVATGLFVTGSGGSRELDGASTVAGTAYTGPDLTYWHLIGGISQNFFGIGRTVAFGEYGESRGGLAQTAFLSGSAAVHSFTADNTVTYWGLGVTQHIDAAAMELFIAYKNYSLDATGFAGGFAVLNTGSAAGGAADFQTVIVGTRINF